MAAHETVSLACDDDDDDFPILSENAMSALQEFYVEQASDKTSNDGEINFEENWQLSQFWYDDNTAQTLANEAIRLCSPSGWITCISCPTVFQKITEIVKFRETLQTLKFALLEYDRRFACYDDNFVYYDYNNPFDVSDKLVNISDVIIVDPPFLSEECLTKTLQTVQHLLKDNGKVILCTGAVMEDCTKKCLNLHTCKFVPKHLRNLMNEFKCFANYDLDAYIS